METTDYKFLSIIIPVYRVERYIEACLNSLLSQSIDHGQVECILVDDCTPDLSMEIVRQRIGRYEGDMSFVCLKHEQNRGLSAARNTGLAHAKGKYVLFVDSDDYLLPDALTLFAQAAADHPNASLIIGNYYDELRATNNYHLRHPKVISNLNKLFLGNTCKITAWNELILRDVLVKHQLTFVEGQYFEDNIFSFRLFSVLPGPAVILPQITYFYRRNQNGIMNQVRYEKVEKSMTDYLAILDDFSSHIDRPLYVGKSMAFINLASIATDYLCQQQSYLSHPQERAQQLKRLQRKMAFTHLRHLRLTLFTLSMLQCRPRNLLFRLRLFRRYYERITALFWRFALATDFLHLTPHHKYVSTR